MFLSLFFVSLLFTRCALYMNSSKKKLFIDNLILCHTHSTLSCTFPTCAYSALNISNILYNTMHKLLCTWMNFSFLRLKKFFYLNVILCIIILRVYMYMYDADGYFYYCFFLLVSCRLSSLLYWVTTWPGSTLSVRVALWLLRGITTKRPQNRWVIIIIDGCATL